MLNDTIVFEEKLFDIIKRLVDRYGHEHLLIGVYSRDTASIERLLTDGSDPIISADEFKSNKKKYLAIVDRALALVLKSGLSKKCVVYNIERVYRDDFSDEYYFTYDVYYPILDTKDNMSDNDIRLHMKYIKEFKKELNGLFDKYKKEFSESINKGELYSNVIKTIKPMIRKSVVDTTIKAFEEGIKTASSKIPLTHPDKKIDKLLAELRQLLLARATIQLKFINFIAMHNNSEADNIISKIKDQINIELKQEISSMNESMVLYELAVALEQL